MDGRMKRKWVGSKFEACMWIYTKEALTKGQVPNLAMEEYLKKRMLSIMLCTNWVCAGTFVDHEWVSESTISQHVEEVLGMELDYEIGIPCVVQRSMLWFSAPSRLNGILQSTTRLSTWRSWTQIVHVGVCGKGSAQNTQKVVSEQGDGRRMDDERES